MRFFVKTCFSTVFRTFCGTSASFDFEQYWKMLGVKIPSIARTVENGIHRRVFHRKFSTAETRIVWFKKLSLITLYRYKELHWMMLILLCSHILISRFMLMFLHELLKIMILFGMVSEIISSFIIFWLMNHENGTIRKLLWLMVFISSYHDSIRWVFLWVFLWHQIPWYDSVQ